MLPLIKIHFDSVSDVQNFKVKIILASAVLVQEFKSHLYHFKGAINILESEHTFENPRTDLFKRAHILSFQDKAMKIVKICTECKYQQANLGLLWK